MQGGKSVALQKLFILARGSFGGGTEITKILLRCRGKIGGAAALLHQKYCRETWTHGIAGSRFISIEKNRIETIHHWSMDQGQSNDQWQELKTKSIKSPRYKAISTACSSGLLNAGVTKQTILECMDQVLLVLDEVLTPTQFDLFPIIYCILNTTMVN